ncbi:MAG TPA: hypothetical protein VE046_05845 [Steroidobacteraceae bacterium]|nr:hypothetical protein [Steroidobacteraceae bacterium]
MPFRSTKGGSNGVKVLYTTYAIAVGGRNGHTRSADGLVDVNLSVPKLLSPKGVEIKAEIGIGTRDEGGFGLKVQLTATVAGLSQADAGRLIEGAHQVCPYSNAIRGNVEVGLAVVANL